MSVRSTVRRGRKIWHVEVRRRGYHRRRFLPRDKFLKRDAVAIEAQMLEEASRPREENLCTNNESSSFASRNSGTCVRAG